MMIKIYSAADLTEAHIVRGMLEADGIEAHVGGHYLQGGIGELAAMDFASVYIDDADRQVAQQLIDTYEHATDLSPDDEHPAPSPFNLATQLFILLACILMVALVLSFI